MNFNFKLDSKEEIVTFALWVDSGAVGGSEFSGAPEKDSAYGSITGNLREDGLLHVTFNYTIEGNRQSEEQLLKIDGNKLIVGKGELEEHGPGQLVLKNPKSVKFDGKALTEVKPIVSVMTANCKKPPVCP
jgi:hypothetical protein